MLENLPSPTGGLAQDLAPFQAALTPWLWAGSALALVGAGLLIARGKSTVAGFSFILACLCAAVACNLARDARVGWEEDAYRRVAALPADELVTYIPEPHRVRLAACGNDNLAADAMWFRSLFFIYETSDARGSGEMIYHMYDVMQDLNPTWKEPQLLGPVLVSALSGENRQMQDNRIALARRLLEKSQQQFPRDYRFYDLEANLYWSSTADLETAQANARAMIQLYQQIFDRYDSIYALHPEQNPILEYVRPPIRAQIAAAAAEWWDARFAGQSLTPDEQDARITDADKQALKAHWEKFRQSAGREVVMALDMAATQWQYYHSTRAELRAHLLMSLDSPDYRNELFSRAAAFCSVLLSELQNPTLNEQERPEKLLSFYRWDDVFRRVGYELEVEKFSISQRRLPTDAEFRQLAWQFHRSHGDPQMGPPPAEPPAPHDPFGWPYRYIPATDGKHFTVHSRFDAVYKTNLKASRLLTLVDNARARLGHMPVNLQEVHESLLAQYPPGQTVPAPVLDSFGPDRDCVTAPCGGTFELQDGHLFAPADVQTWWKVRKEFNKLGFDAVFDKTRPYAETAVVSEPDQRLPFP
ncbi:MAG TPA: hypothetical protein VL860_15455 [Planctomycetota bacterium]|nr:hypothetical protein [Planctomycetota bacterium]